MTRAKEAARRAVDPEAREQVAVRRRLADRYLIGSGVEIGALHMPLRVPRRTSVQYVDRMPVAELRSQYPELRDYDLVEPDIVDDGESLHTLADCSVDFVIGNHLIEHTQDPIGTLDSWVRVLRPGGVLYMAVPDRRKTFDRDRPETSIEHLVLDHEEGAEGSRREHYEEWARLVRHAPTNGVSALADELEAIDYSIHFHTFTPKSFLQLLLHCHEAHDLPIEIAALETNGHEFIVVARRTETLEAASPWPRKRTPQRINQARSA